MVGLGFPLGLHCGVVDGCPIIASTEQQNVLELTQLAGLDIREDVFLIVSCSRSVALLCFSRGAS